MRSMLRPEIVCLVLLGLTAGAPQILVAQNAPKAEKADAISGTGCVEAGVEAGCLVLKDTKTGTLYNLFFTGKKPPVGMGIEFSGTVHDGFTTCMQGKPVNVKEKDWKQIKLECKSTSSKKAS